MNVSERLARSAVVPVVVLDDAKDAVATAKALLAGGVDVMEITFRTAAAADSIKAVAENCPDMLVGAGTVITLEQCKKAVECGAKFIVAPGFDEEVVRWCVDNGVAVTPGCVTPTEIMAAMKLGLKVVKFFPAGVYGGLSAMKALSGPFGGIKFIPTGGVNGQNIGEFIAAPFIHAVGGSWVCPKADIAAGNFEKITALCKQARSAALGFEVAHIGVNCEDAAAASAVCEKLNEAFGLPVKEGNSSIFASNGLGGTPQRDTAKWPNDVQDLVITPMAESMATTNDVNVRTAPSINSEVLMTMPTDTVVAVIGVSEDTEDGAWYEIWYNEVCAYLNAKYVKSISSAAASTNGSVGS